MKRHSGIGSTHAAARIVLLMLLSVAFLLSFPQFHAGSSAFAQEVRERKSIFELLFRSSKPKVKKERVNVRKNRIKRKKPIREAGDPAVTGAEVAVEKLPDAKKVLVIGDFMATALSDGLVMSFISDPGIVIEKRTDGSSGLVRSDHLDWPVTLAAYIAEVKPALIVIMLGANDRQQMTVNGKKEKFQSAAWNAEYEKRIAAIIAAAGDQKIPFIWTGLPTFQSPSLTADAATLNNFYRSKSELAGGEFIDIWDGFADENGKFIASGSDVNGQPVRLRGSDGLSLTKAGKRKMAFYIEKPIRKLIGEEYLPSLARLNSTDLLQGSLPTIPTIANIESVPPISLADPELDGTAKLLDIGLIPKGTGNSPRDLLIEKGETIAGPEGRVDDFQWKPAIKPAS